MAEKPLLSVVSSSSNDVLFVGTRGYIIGYDCSLHPPKMIWKTNLKFSMGFLVGMVTDKRHLYAACFGRVYKINPNTGEIIWKVNPEGLGWSTVGIIHVEDMLICAANGKVVLLEKTEGKTIWNATVRYVTMAIGQPVNLLVVESLLFVGSSGNVHALELKTGKVLWSNPLSGKKYGDITLGDYHHKGMEGRFLIVGINGYILALGQQSGKVIVEGNLEKVPWVPVSQISHNDSIFFGASGQVTCHNPFSLKQKWKNNLKGCGYSMGFSLLLHKHTISGEEVLLVGMNGIALALNPENGEVIWKRVLRTVLKNFVTLFMHQGVLFAGTMGLFYGLNPDDGTVHFQDGLAGMDYAVVNFGSLEHSLDCNACNITQIKQ